VGEANTDKIEMGDGVGIGWDGIWWGRDGVGMGDDWWWWYMSFSCERELFANNW
jgi:hypothetical protein